MEGPIPGPESELRVIPAACLPELDRALRQLRDEGLLEFRRGRGITVAGTAERGAVVEQARELLQFARKHGYKPEELIEIIQQLG